MLSAQLTRSMTLQMVTYNPEAVVFGYFKATFRCVMGVAFAVTAGGVYFAAPSFTFAHSPPPSQPHSLVVPLRQNAYKTSIRIPSVQTSKGFCDPYRRGALAEPLTFLPLCPPGGSTLASSP
jgi:hypothetical protein